MQRVETVLFLLTKRESLCQLDEAVNDSEQSHVCVACDGACIFQRTFAGNWQESKDNEGCEKLLLE